MKMIRTKGLLSLFIGLPLLLVVLMFISGPVVKLILESQLSSINGAEVNIDAVDISYWPFTMTLSDLQATDKESPEQNLIAVDKALLAIKSESLLKGKLVISDMKLENIQFSTARKSQGEVFKNEATEVETTDPSNQKAGFVSGSLDIPDINDLMNKADLKSPAAFKAFEEEADKTKKSWHEVEVFLDDKKKWDAYKVRYRKIKAEYKKGNTKQRLKALKKLKSLNKEIKVELKTFSQQRKKLKTDFNNLKQTYKAAKDSPDNDLDTMKNSYSLNSNNLENISRLIFDDKITGYVSLAKKYYKKIQPYLESEKEESVQTERSKGKYVLFEDHEPEPDFLIEDASFTARLPSGLFQGTATDIASNQKVQNKASVMQLKGDKLKHSKAEEMKLVVDVRDKKASIVKFSYDITARKISDYKVAGGDTLPLVMKSAQLDMSSEISLINNKLKGNLDSHFTHVNFISNKDTSGRSLSSIIAAAFLKVDRFKIDATANGKVLKPKLKIKSDIDNKINKQLKVRLNQIKKEYALELKAKLKQRYAGQLENVENIMSGINKYKKDLEDKQSALENKLNKYKK